MTLFRAALLVFALLVALIGGLWGAGRLLAPQHFPLRGVRFEGEFQHVTHAELEAAVADVARGNFLELDLDAVKARVERLPWVYQAEVRRQWPRDLHIRFTEHELVARWNETAWVSRAAVVVRVNGEGLPADPPQFAGPEGTQATVLARYDDFSRLLAEAGLSIKNLTLTPRRTWRLELANGLTLVLDREQPEKKIGRFARVYGRLVARAGASIRRADLRYTNGFSVEWASGRPAAAGRRATVAREEG